ncbi:MAG: hypothetical protein R2876_02005 [Eubacteriales bacterium]
MIANQIYIAALALLDEVDENGDIINSPSYSKKAVSIINLLLLEITSALLIDSIKIDSLVDEIEIDNSSATRALTYGLAAQFSLSDKDGALYNEFYSEFRRALNELAMAPEPIEISVFGLNGNAGRRL